MQCHCFFKYHVTFFKMTMKKAIKNEKTLSFFYGMAYVIKSEKRELEKAKYGMQMPSSFKKVVCFTDSFY